MAKRKGRKGKKNVVLERIRKVERVEQVDPHEESSAFVQVKPMPEYRTPFGGL